MYNGNKTCGFIITAKQDLVKVMSEQGKIQELRMNEIDKKLVQDKKTIARDSMGNALQIDDVVNVTNRQSNFFQQKGVIKSI